MPNRSLIAAPKLESLLETHGCETAIAEYQKLCDVAEHLATHLIAVKQQTDATLGGIESSVGQVEASPPPQLLGR